MEDLTAYFPYCDTERQKQVLTEVIAHGTPTSAAKASGMNESSYRSIIRAIKTRAALAGYSPSHDMMHTVPDTHVVKGISSYYDRQGNLTGQWVKSTLRQESLKELAEELADALLGTVPAREKIPAPKASIKDMLTAYPMGDPHIGLYSWKEECGEDFDCDIAERDLCSAIDILVESAMPTEKALLINLGDFFHSDNQENRTKQSGHALDVDSRKQRVNRIGVRIMTYLIDKALEKHKEVTVINEVGNHDDESSYMLSLILDAYYRNNKRVVIDLAPRTNHYYKFGKVLIGVTHGNNCKADALGQIMAADRPEDWGQTEFRYWLVGHIHHTSKKEVPGAVIESFRTLAAKDAWHTSKGYRSGRDMIRITYHKEFGETGRTTLGIKQIQAA